MNPETILLDGETYYEIPIDKIKKGDILRPGNYPHKVVIFNRIHDNKLWGRWFETYSDFLNNKSFCSDCYCSLDQVFYIKGEVKSEKTGFGKFIQKVENHDS